MTTEYERKIAKELTERLNADPTIRALFGGGRQPRYRYWQDGNWMFCYGTESMGDGRYASWIYAPVGTGSRTPGKAREWKPFREVRHTLRRAAKARALRLYQAHKDGDR